MRASLFLTACLLTTALAGCAVTPGADSEEFTLSRQIRVHVDSTNIESESDNPYDYIEAAFVVRVNGADLVPSTAVLVYQDRTGATVSKPLSTFTQLPVLTKGTEVRIADANITSDAVLLVDGVEKVSRARPHTQWWNVGGYPIGVRMDPGAALGYRVTAAAVESFSITDVRGDEGEAKDLVLDRAAFDLGVKYEGDLDLSLASAPSSVVAESEHSAFPLDWTSTGKLTLPFTAEANGRNLSSGEAFTAGVALAPTSGMDFDARGKLWWNVSGSPVRADLAGGSWRSSMDVTAWLTGIPELEGTFSCAGKSKAENCRPTEIPTDLTQGNGTYEPDTVNLDGFPWDVDPEVQANLTRFLDEDLVPGDELRFDVDIDSRKLQDFDGDDGPEWVHVTGGAVLRAVGYESVTVKAGTFEALKLVERVEMRLDVGAVKEDDRVVLKPFVLEERFVDTTFWLERGTFIPLRIDQTIPFDLDKVVDLALDNLGEEAWADAPIEPLMGRNVDAKVEGTSTLELTRHVAGARFSPYAVIGGFHSVGFLPLIAYAGSMGGHAEPAVSEFGYPYYDDHGYDAAIPTYPGGYDAYEGTDGETGMSSVSFSMTQASASDGLVVDFTVVSTSEGLTLGRLDFAVDDERIGYTEDEGEGWCLVDPATDACAEPMSAYFREAAAGDTLRFTYDGIGGAVVTVLDAYTGTTLQTLVVG